MAASRNNPRRDAFERFMKSVGDRPADVSRRADVPVTTIYSFLNRPGASLKGSIEAKIAQAYDLPVEAIFGGELNETAEAPPPSPDAVLIGKDHYWPVPVYDIDASAGAGALVEDGDPIAYQVFRDQFLQRISRAPLKMLAVIRVSGDSMWETLHDGDTVLVDRTADRVVKDGIYILQFEGELLVKRCQRNIQDGSVLIASDNPRYQPMTVTDPRVLNVIGRVVWIGRALG
jgi:phage repressor protein C with HTH and peptisase S24 domain